MIKCWALPAHRPMEPLYIQFPDALVIAARDNDFEIVGKLLDGGVSPNLRDESGCTALHAAAKEGWSSMVVLLLQRGAAPNALDSDGDTPHDYAVFMDHQDIATELVQHGASVREGQSAIQRNWDSIQYAQENVRAAQTLLGLIEQAKQEKNDRSA